MTPENAKLVADLSKCIPFVSLTSADLERSNLVRAIAAIEALSAEIDQRTKAGKWADEQLAKNRGTIADLICDRDAAADRAEHLSAKLTASELGRDQLRAELARLRAAPGGWIKLSERKPTKEDADEDGYVMTCTRYGVRDLNEVEIVVEDDCPCTHWQRLPAPPAQKKTATQLQAEQEAEAIIGFSVPGGDLCDPQIVADNIREYFARHARGQGKDGAK